MPSRTSPFAPFVRPGEHIARSVAVPEGAADPPAEDDLPAIEQFLDELPSIDDYLADHENGTWAVEGWEIFDWGSFASLGQRRGSETGTTNAASNRARERYVSSASRGGAEEIAAALDAMAKQIRSGEIRLDQLTGIPPEAAMAAALAAILRARG